MSQFIMRLADIKAWLEGTEQKMAKEQSPQERQVMLKVLGWENMISYNQCYKFIFRPLNFKRILRLYCLVENFIENICFYYNYCI